MTKSNPNTSKLPATQPLAERMRPKSIRELVGQTHLIGEGKLLTRITQMVDPVTKEIKGLIPSLIMYGTPGIGKTSIATALSYDLDIPFDYFNAGVQTKKDLTTIMNKGSSDAPIILLVDEIHRLTKPNQDLLLMAMENGSVILIGATTENPYMSIVPALRSRSSIVELKQPSPDEISEMLKRALTDTTNGLAMPADTLSDEDIRFIAEQAGGDVRLALNTLELVVQTTPHTPITRSDIRACLQQRNIGGDADGDAHYNTLSAFQKSIRGSDVDASLHYLARLIQTGDIQSIHRRLLVIAFEDIGLANPALMPVILSAVETSERVGLPEARIPLSHAVIELALSPKSNRAYSAINRALDALKTGRSLDIPAHLQDAHYKGAEALGRGVGYQYPHDFPHGYTNQQYLPDEYQQDTYLITPNQDLNLVSPTEQALMNRYQTIKTMQNQYVRDTK